MTAPLDRIAGFARDLVVQAGAGTGKTHALVTLYLHLVGGVHEAREAVAPPRIAVMTFTEKAAGELRERIRTRLGAMAAAPDEVARLEPTLAAAAQSLGVALPDGDGWTAALLALGAAPVGTFHAFAGTLLRRHAARASIDPDFQLLEEADQKDRVTQAAERTILDALTASDVAVEELVAQFGFQGAGRTIGLVDLVVKLRERRAEEGLGGLGLDGNYDPATLARQFAAAKARFTAVAQDAHTLELTRGSEGQRLVSELAGRLATLDFSLPADVESVLAVGKKLRGPKTTEWKRALEESGRNWTESYYGERAAPWAAALARLVDGVDQRYRAHKQKTGAVDFADLLVIARDLLRDDPAVRATVRGRFDAILVDEFQDTNPVQAQLVELIGARQPDDERARLFVVGDRKQSIYEFRGADVAVFARAAAQLVTRGGGEELLTQSRRSSPGVLALCNALFARTMVSSGEHEWEVAYDPPRDDLSPLRADAPEWAGAELLKVAPGLVSAEARGREARAIARRMAQLRGQGCKLGSMAMLLRRFTHVTDYLDALRAAGLPYFVVRGRGFFAAQEVRDLAAAMTVLDNPDDLLALVAVLRSPIVGVSDETLARLSLAGQLRARVLFDRGTLLPAALPAVERAALIRFGAQFRELAITADRLGPTACAQAIVDGADLVPLLAATADGEQRVANLLRLIEKARAFESDGGDLRAFTNWLRRAAAPGGEAEAAQAQIADERDDVVRVMTVHQAKGLEFPIVFVPSCGAMERVETAPIVYDAGAGLGLKLRDECRPGQRVHTTASRRVSELRTRRERAESLRVFYVAATRARDLVVFSGERVRGKQSWRGSLDELVADERTVSLLREVDGDALPPSPQEQAVAAAARRAAEAAATAATDALAANDDATAGASAASSAAATGGASVASSAAATGGASVASSAAATGGASVASSAAAATTTTLVMNGDATAAGRSLATTADAAEDAPATTTSATGSAAASDAAGTAPGDPSSLPIRSAAVAGEDVRSGQSAAAAPSRVPLDGAFVSPPVVDAAARLHALVNRPLPRPSSLTVAVTQLADFQLCPRRYQQFHALGLQEHPTSARAASPDVLLDARDDDAAPPLDPLRRGTLAHRLLEHARFAAGGADVAAIDQLLADDGYDVKDPAVADVRAHVLGFLDSTFARGLDGAALRKELPFLLSVPFEGGVLYLRGQIDLVLLQPDGVTVVDYKHARRGDPDDYRFQLEAYALAARRLYPQAPAVRTGLAFLKEADPSPQIAAAPPSEPFVDELAALGRDLARARAVDSWDMRPLSTCHRLRCGFIYRCYPAER